MQLLRFSGYALVDDDVKDITELLNTDVIKELFQCHYDSALLTDNEEMFLGNKDIDLAKLERLFIFDDYETIVNNDRIVIGGTYTHFKGKTVTLLSVAKYSENPKMMFAVYHCENGTYARPLDMFLSEVDHDKYPNVKQKYRFELVR